MVSLYDVTGNVAIISSAGTRTTMSNVRSSPVAGEKLQLIGCNVAKLKQIMKEIYKDGA